MGDTADRTIPATPRRREAARRQGLMPAAALPAWAAAAGVTILLLPAWARATIPAAAEMLRAAVRDAAGPGGQPLTAALLLPTVALVLAAAAAALTVRGVCDGFSWQPGRALPDPGRIDPRAGLARIFSAATLASVAGQGLALVLLVAVAWAALAPLVGTGAEALREPQTALDRAGRAAAGAAGAAAAVAAAHWALARRRFEQRLRMTPQEFADEARGLQADPKVRLLQRRRAASAARAQAAGGRSAAGAA